MKPSPKSSGLEKVMRILKVDWIDACTRGGWGTIEYAKTEKPVSVATVGFEIINNKTEIVLAQGVSSDSVLNITAIPKAWVKKIIVLQKTKKQPPTRKG